MAATFRQILNNVLVNLGESSRQITGPIGSTTVTDNYVIQLCSYINHIKEEVEAATQWSALWQTYNINYLFPNTTQQIADMTTAGKQANGRSYFARMYNARFGREVPLCFNVTTFGIPFLVGEMPLADLIYYNTVLNQTPVAYSTNFAVQDIGQDNLQLLMYPAANANFIIQATLVTPQPRIDPTVAGQAAYAWASPSWVGSAVGLDSPILVPNYPIELGSTWFAMEERGEELGASSMYSEDRYREALDDNVTRDPGSTALQMIVA